MRILGFCNLLVLILLFSCEKDNSDDTTKYRISGLELNGDTIVRFTYSNKKLIIVERLLANRTYTFIYDSNNRIEKITGKTEYVFSYSADNKKIYIHQNGSIYGKEIELNEDGNPAHTVTQANDNLTIYHWHGDNLIGYNDDISLVYNTYPNPFYEILNNFLWSFVYIELTGLSDFDFIVIPSKNFVAKVIRTGSFPEEYEISYTYDEQKDLVTSITHASGKILNILYETE
jgi:hypothetical protein